VRFNQRIENRAAAERALKVTVTPAQPGDWHWVSDREVHYRPENYWLPGTRVSLNARLYGVDLGGGVYGETDGTLNFSVHDSWVGVADGASHQMRIFHNGQMVNSMPISMGQPNMPTHAGPHVISAQQPQIDMNSCSYGVCPPNPNAYNEIESWDEQISADGEYVHENPDTVAQQGNADVSHGCINLNQANAQWFYQHFGQGDVVNVVNSGGPPLPITDTYGDWEIPWQVWHNGGGA
jgi:lipoprotein-anchoring transpeptidase ErfK/SrfK